VLGLVAYGPRSHRQHARDRKLDPEFLLIWWKPVISRSDLSRIQLTGIDRGHSGCLGRLSSYSDIGSIFGD
jgi:hypothetical protein